MKTSTPSPSALHMDTSFRVVGKVLWSSWAMRAASGVGETFLLVRFWGDWGTGEGEGRGRYDN